jgi:Domain of unknown function (DU1801)
LVAMMREASNAEPMMWGTNMVGFGRYQYKYASGHGGEYFVIGFAPRKNDLTLYLMAAIESFEGLVERLGKHKSRGACLYIKSLADIDRAVLQAMLAEAVARTTGQRTA